MRKMLKVYISVVWMLFTNLCYSQNSIHNDTININKHTIEKIEFDVSFHLANTKPFPLPAKSKIQTTISWFTQSEDKMPRFALYDVNGCELDNINIKFIKSDTWSGILTLDCSMLEQGVYLILVKLSGNSITIPFIVSK